MKLCHPLRPLLKEVLVPLFCAVFALFGPLQGHAQAAATKAAGGPAGFVLCLPDHGSGAPEAPHDCDACCLSLPHAMGPGRIAGHPPRYAKAFHHSGLLSAPVLEEPVTPSWPRGPPAHA